MEYEIILPLNTALPVSESRDDSREEFHSFMIYLLKSGLLSSDVLNLILLMVLGALVVLKLRVMGAWWLMRIA